jgi:MarR family transcriptional regulator, organic hydroperoxide resistance regulator
MVSPTDFPPPSVGFLVWHLSMRWRAEMDRELAQYGLTGAQYSVLASLYGLTRTGAQPSQRELAEFSGLETMYLSKLIRVLERAGLVERTRNAADARALQLTLTDEGIRTVRLARAKVLELERHRLAALAPEDADRLRDALTTLLHNTGDNA